MPLLFRNARRLARRAPITTTPDARRVDVSHSPVGRQFVTARLVNIAKEAGRILEVAGARCVYRCPDTRGVANPTRPVFDLVRPYQRLLEFIALDNPGRMPYALGAIHDMGIGAWLLTPDDREAWSELRREAFRLVEQPPGPPGS